MNKTCRRKESVEAILIDDDLFIHYVWDQCAKIGNGRYIGFYSSAEFFLQAETLDKNIPVYVDSHLKGDLPGELVAKSIRELGFKTIYLHTSQPQSEDLSQMDWITEIRDKGTPWDHLVKN